MEMRILLVTLALLLSAQTYATDNLSNSDHIGEWRADWTAVPDESQELVIMSDGSSTFIRRFHSGKTQTFTARDIEYIEDLLLIKYISSEGALVYKLVLSGWKSYGKFKLYGTMYMYNDGVQYNGLPVSFSRGKFSG